MRPSRLLIVRSSRMPGSCSLARPCAVQLAQDWQLSPCCCQRQGCSVSSHLWEQGWRLQPTRGAILKLMMPHKRLACAVLSRRCMQAASPMEHVRGLGLGAKVAACLL